MRARMTHWTGAGLALAFALAAPAVAHAGNGLHPRTPVEWADDTACMTVVDRSADPVVQFNYGIPFEDTDVSEDEVSDSRTHQFAAFCRDKDPQTVLPNWFAWEDVLDAGMMPLDVDPDEVPPSNVLDLSDEWDGCWTRITADDERRPITDAAAAEPVVWDTTGLTAGTYVVYGYTYEPAFNVYVRRPGVVKVVDDPALEASGPAAAITTKEQNLYKNEETTIEGCVSAMEGSTVTGYWAVAEQDPQWVPFVEDEPVADGALALPFLPPEEAAGETSMIRIDVTDPMGRTHTAYMAELIIVLLQENPGECEDDDGGSFISDPNCGGADGSGSGTGGDDDDDDDGTTSGDDGPTETTGPGADGGDDGGKTCSVGGSRPLGSLGLMLLGLGLLGWRRRQAR